jgi:HlyD family secretion protein
MKAMKYIVPVFISVLLLSGCNKSKLDFDATGTFEAEEIMVSSEAMGQIEQLNFNEGDQVKEGQFLGFVDSTQVYLKLQQLNAQIASIAARKPEVATQLKVFDDQIAVLKIKKETLTKEKARFEKLVQQKAAPSKQLDDIESQLEELDAQVALVRQQKLAASSNLNVQLKGLNQDPQALIVQKEQLQDQLSKYRLVSPAGGTILSKYVNEKELAAIGKPLYKIGKLDTLTLRAYITGDQFSAIKLQQKVKVFVDKGDDYAEHQGVVYWISDKAEFTPKTIQTKKERANLVYAIKVAVPNKEGLLKIGMTSELKLN